MLKMEGMVTATDLYTLLYRDVAPEEMAALCAISLEDLEHICTELERAGVAAPADDRKSWVPGPAAEEDVLAFQEQVYRLGIDLDLHRAAH
jgi:hypothetical protein